MVGLIRRKGLEGHGSYFGVYLKYLRDQMIGNYLSNEKNFKKMNPVYDYLRRWKDNHNVIYKEASESKASFLDVDYE